MRQHVSRLDDTGALRAAFSALAPRLQVFALGATLALEALPALARALHGGFGRLVSLELALEVRRALFSTFKPGRWSPSTRRESAESLNAPPKEALRWGTQCSRAACYEMKSLPCAQVVRELNRTEPNKRDQGGGARDWPLA